jgi:peptidoglycan hydrolase-like protein with peptidoglycan-binding domain
VAEPAQEKAGEEGVPTTLSLTADLPAAAQASIDPSSRETVRRVQRSLKAEGLDPGPIDGILGPRTRRAIIKFQGAQGLELTGELDARTLRLILSAA